MLLETKEQIILAAKAHKISVRTAVGLLNQLKQVEILKKEIKNGK